jgi:hypothetical protein
MLLQDKTNTVIIVSAVAGKSLTDYFLMVFNCLSPGHLTPGTFEARRVLSWAGKGK